MKAQVIHSFGDPSVFTFTEMQEPIIKPGHVLVKVHATSVNPIDCKVRSGAVPAISPEFPAILHGDVAGCIESVGEGVSHLKKNDEIFGFAGGFRGTGGALAEYMLADANCIVRKPQSLSMLESSALPLVCITAWIGLFEKAKLESGMNILIHGGVGGVGHIAVQLAKWCGAKVTTTIRKNEDIPIVKSFGADEVINVQEEDVEKYKSRLTNNLGFDLIFDTVGGSNLDKSFAAAAMDGVIVTTAARSANDLTPLHVKGLSLHCVSMLIPLLTNINREKYNHILGNIAKIADQGKLKPRIDSHRFTLEEAAKAHELFESGKAKGKVVISIGRED